jgi:formylglycine-generating enzyme required for sulfatase activity
MKSLKSPIAVLAFAAGVFSISSLHAVVIDFVLVGNPGNPADSTGYGAVAYDYKISTHEVTNAQYAEFLNAVAQTDTHGLYSDSMGSSPRNGIVRSGVSGSYSYTVKTDMGNKPVNFVSWYDAARFANWLHNSQPTGLQTLSTTEGGAYTLTGNTGLITKESTATVWIPTENEWYKAAYYDPTASGTGNYWLYPTRSDSAPTVGTAGVNGDISNPGSNVVNYGFGADWNNLDGNVTTVGSALSGSYYGTFDQGGNLWEWNDAIIGPMRGLRGGAFVSGSNFLAATHRPDALLAPQDDSNQVGFRVASVPEPSVTVLGLLASGLLLRRRRG